MQHPSASTKSLAATKYVLICQNRTCLKQGSAEVLSVFRTREIPDCVITGTGCMGQCGNGPMVQVLPEQIWYNRVQPIEVPVIVEQHLLSNRPVQTMLYSKFHPC